MKKVVVVLLLALLSAIACNRTEPAGAIFIDSHLVYTPPVVHGSPERVLLLADSQSAELDVQQALIDGLDHSRYNFVAFAGDVVGGACSNAACLDALWAEQFDIFGALGALQWHFAPGNHDYDSGWALSIAAWAYWVGPRYHWFEHSAACWFFVDDQWWNSTQATWLQNAASQCDRRWRILVKHVPLPHGPPTTYWAEQHPARYAGVNADVVLSGHRHELIAYENNGTLYLTLPSMAFAQALEPYQVQGDVVYTPEPVPVVGYGELDVSSSVIRWRVYEDDGTLLLEGTLQ